MKIIEVPLRRNGVFTHRSKTDEIILHHAEAETASVETVNSWHLDRGWVGIGYHYYIRKNGEVYRGRPEWAVGAHAVGHNDRSIGVCCEGNFMVETMSETQLVSVKALLRDITERLGALTLKRHKDVNSTDCPGKNYPWEAVQRYEEGEDEMTEDEVKRIVHDALAADRYNTVDEVPGWAKPTVQKLVEKGYLQGGGSGLGLTEDLLRTLVVNDRAGLYKA